MIALVERMTREGITTRQDLRKTAAPKAKAGRPRSYVFSYRAPSKDFNLKLQFKKSQVEREEIIKTLLGIIEELRSSKQ
jgi:hypothetical protein